MESMKVGELARRTGLTVRTLHHYDEIGLLSPSFRSEAGYRQYTKKDARRLAQILTLRSLGLGLEEVRSCLDRPDVSMREMLERHVGRLRRQIDLEQSLLRRLETTLTRLDLAGELTIEELSETLEVLRMFEKYYTPEQLEQLKKRGELVGQARIREVEAEWMELLELFTSEMRAGTDPGSDSVQELARRARSLIEEFTGGDAGIERSLRNMYQQEGAENVWKQAGHSAAPGVGEYMARAMQAAEE